MAIQLVPVRVRVQNDDMAGKRSSAAPTAATYFPQRLRNESLAPVVVFAGAERWFRDQGIELLAKRVLPDGDPGGAFVRIDARNPDDRNRVANAVEELRSASLFATSKIVLVENPEGAPADALPKASTRSKSPVIRLATAGLEHPVPNSVLVLSTAQPVKGRGALRVAPLIEAGAWVIDCRALYDAPGPWERGAAAHDHELGRFLVQRAQKSYRKKMPLDVAHALTRFVGSELADLDGALASVALYVGERETITADDVHTAVGETREDPMWRIGDAIWDGRHQDALEQTTATFDRGTTDARGASVVRPEALFAMLHATLFRGYRQVLAGSEALGRGENPTEIARANGVPPFLSDQFLGRCRRDPRKLLKLNRAFLDAETGVRGGGVPPRLAAERLVVSLTGAAL